MHLRGLVGKAVVDVAQPQEGTHLGQQFLLNKGPRQASVGAGLQARQPRFGDLVGDKEQDGQEGVARVRTQPPAPLEALFETAGRFDDGEMVREEVVGFGVGRQDRTDLVAGSFEEVAQGDRGVVLAAEQNSGKSDGLHTRVTC